MNEEAGSATFEKEDDAWATSEKEEFWSAILSQLFPVVVPCPKRDEPKIATPNFAAIETEPGNPDFEKADVGWATFEKELIGLGRHSISQRMTEVRR